MIVAGIQHDIVWEEPDANFDRLAPMIAKAAAAGARLVVLSEMFSTGFSMKTERIAEPPDGRSVSFLVDQARANDVWLCASVPERTAADERPFNQCVVAAPDGVTHRYAKIHPFSYGREHEHYAPGERFLTVDIEGTRCSFFVCYDLRFADEFWEVAKVTDCYVVPANWPASRREHWMALLRARAIENQAFVIAANQIGTHPDGHRSGGRSMIVNPLGEILTIAGDAETTIAAEVDPRCVQQVRAEFPFLQDRR